MFKSISSYTANNSTYPEYISIEKREDHVMIAVRAPITVRNGGHPIPGEITEIKMSLKDFTDFIIDAADWLARYNPPCFETKELPI